MAKVEFEIMDHAFRAGEKLINVTVDGVHRAAIYTNGPNDPPGFRVLSSHLRLPPVGMMGSLGEAWFFFLEEKHEDENSNLHSQDSV